LSLEGNILVFLIALALAVHVAAGTVALCSGLLAVLSRKGARLHRVSGTVFLVSMLVMAVFACYLAVALPAQIPNLLIAVLTIYLIMTAWLTVRRTEPAIILVDRMALAFILCLFAPFGILSFQLAAGLQPFLKSSVALVGPVRVAIFSFTLIIACAAIGDARLLMRGGIAGRARIARHLWRMCLGLTFAAGSCRACCLTASTCPCSCCSYRSCSASGC
jgi:uncharacterized membrane protein